jgi:hypothetical protein
LEARKYPAFAHSAAFRKNILRDNISHFSATTSISFLPRELNELKGLAEIMDFQQLTEHFINSTLEEQKRDTKGDRG